MWQNIKYYAIALAIILVTTFISTGLQLLETYLPTGHPASTLVTNLSGVTIGAIIMVIGFLRDNRLDQERKRTDSALARAAAAETKAATAEVVIQQERERADRAEERADRYLAELERLRESYVTATEAVIQRLREFDERHPREAS